MPRCLTLALRRFLATSFLLLLCGAAWSQARPLLIGAEDDFAPFSSVDKGRPVGMAVDIVSAIFAKANIPIKLIPVPYGRCMKDALVGRLAGCFNTAPDATLRSQYLFHSFPLFTEETVVLVRKDSAASNLVVRDLQNKTVLITRGYTYGDTFEADPLIDRLEVIGDLNVLRGIHSKQADYGLMYRRVLAHQLRGKGKEMAGAFKAAGTLSNNPLYLSFSKILPDAVNVVKRFDEAHVTLLRSKTIANIEQRWE